MQPRDPGGRMTTIDDSGATGINVVPLGATCTVCGGNTVHQFYKEYLGAKVGYFRCLFCDHLTAGNISDVPSYDRGTYFAEIDTGWQDRNRSALELIVLLSRLPGIGLDPKSVILDYGCGTGMLVRGLSAAGFDSYGFEPHQGQNETSERVLSRWNDVRKVIGRAKLVTCIEVLEHLRDPDEVLERISDLLAGDGYLFISTEPYERRKHKSDWYYLNPAAGHVSIYTGKSLLLLMSRHGFSPVVRIHAPTWLFRLVTRRRRIWFESGYYLASRLRFKLGIRVRY